MKINSKEFRVREGYEVDLKKWPTKVDPEAVGFEKGSGILAAAVTAHPDFNDEPLFANKGGEWHFHWVVLLSLIHISEPTRPY